MVDPPVVVLLDAYEIRYEPSGDDGDLPKSRQRPGPELIGVMGVPPNRARAGVQVQSITRIRL
jgi:hypothetical protein